MCVLEETQRTKRNECVRTLRKAIHRMCELSLKTRERVVLYALVSADEYVSSLAALALFDVWKNAW